jgi:RNA polymerase sigma factor (sigma-70 family)
MSGSRLGGLLRYLRRVSDAEGTGDAQLLQRFVRDRDEAAFAELVDRHGPMVLGVCRRVLRDAHDAEDAFQATFLVLAHKARSISRPQALGGWLHCVARRTALRARLGRGRLRTQESVLDDLPAPGTTEDLAWHELRPALDEEVNRLPRKYREPVVLCHLQEKTYAEAAKDLGLAAGTVSSRLARARDLLRKRLARRGLTLSSGLLVGLLSQRALSAAVPGALRDATTRAVLRWATGQAILAGATTESVAALTAGVLRTMFLAKMRFVLIVVLALGVVAFGLGAGMYARWAPADQPADPVSAAAPEPDKQPGPNQPERKKTFDPEFGYAWFIDPWDIGEQAAEGHFAGVLVQGGGDKSKEAITVLLFSGSDGDLYLVQNHMGPVGNRVQYRPVLLDAEGKRYVPAPGSQGGSDNGDMYLRSDVYRLSARDLPVRKVRYVGVEQLTPEGRKALDARARELARKAGIEVPPPGFEGEAYDFTLTTLDGKQLRAADLRGKTVLIHCWGTTYANPNLHGLKQLYEKHHKDGLEIIGVCLDADAETVKKVCAEKGLTWPQVVVPVKDEKTRQSWIEATGLREGVTRCLDRKGVCRGDAGNNPDHLGEIKLYTGLAP